jgi:6-phosphogluconolactonase
MPGKEIHILPDNASVLNSAAEFLRNTIADVLATKAYCSIALSGGTTPRGLYERLASPSFSKDIPWERLRLFLGDERYVPHNHPDSNIRMVRESLFRDREPAPNTLFPVDTNLTPSQAAASYEQTLRKVLGSEGAVDIVLLGLGDDAHTASLFPHTKVLEEHVAWVKNVYVEKLKTWRITFTLPLINCARSVVFLVSGASKASAMKQVLEGKFAPHTFPAQAVQPRDGVVHWFVDEEAAKEIER